MKGFEKGMSPSKSNSNSNRNLPSSGSVENDENDSNWGKLTPEIANNKTGYGKHFMAGVTRKKILAEIKGIPKASVAQAHEKSNLGSEKRPPEKGVFDSSVKVYDPLTNYLSPRPRFLRFNPNRRREIFERLEKELNTSLDSEEASGDEEVVDSSLSPPKGSGDGDGNGIDCCEVKEEGIGEIVASSRSPQKESDVDRRNGGTSDEDNASVVDGYEREEEEEEMEERGGCVRGVLKLLFTLIACLLLASYMFPMNSPTDSTTLSGVVIKNETVEFVSKDLSGNGFFEVGGGSSVDEAGVEVGGCRESDESTEAQIVEYLEWNESVGGEDNSVEVEVEEANYGENDDSVEAEIAEYSEWDEEEMFENVNVDGEDAQFEGVRDARFEFRVDESEHSLAVKNDENVDGGFLLDMEVVSSYAGLDEDNLYKDEVVETENLVIPETVESEDDSSNPLEPIFEETPVESKDTDETGSVQELVGSQEELSGYMYEADDIGDDDEVGMEKSQWNTVIAGVSALLAVVSTSLAIVYHSRQQSRRGTSSKETPKPKLAVEGNANPVLLPSIDRKVEFLPRAPLPSHPMREAPRELSRHIHVPTVELIGEIVVGQPRNSENSRDNAATMSWTRGSRPQVAPAPSQPSSLELHPSASSTSSGSFTTESKTSKKERGQIKEAMVVPTPVRRSSRLRNRPAVTSP